MCNADGYKEYVAALPAQIWWPLRHAGGKTEVVEGKNRSRVVVLEFPSYESAMTCYRSPEYAKAIALRQANADADLIVIEGYDEPHP